MRPRYCIRTAFFEILGVQGIWMNIRIGDEVGYIYKTYSDQALTAQQISDVQNAGRNAGVDGNVDTVKAEAARYNANESMFDNVTRAVSAVETITNFRAADDIGDGAGLSVGGFQFTEKSSLYKLVVKYLEIGGTVAFSDAIRTRLVEATQGNMLSASERSTVQGLLHRAYDEDYDHYIIIRR